MPGDLRGAESAFKRNGRNAEQYSAQTYFTPVVKTDNGTEFAGEMLDRCVYEREFRIDFSRPGTPTDNATMESLNGRSRQECLNENWFMCLEDARCKIEACAYTITTVIPILHWAG